jgi:uncharacterized membrane protein
MSAQRRRPYGTAAFWIFAGTMHFVRPKPYEAIVPRQIERWKREVTIASGVAELVGGIAVLPERTRRGARWWLLATLLAIYPANIQMALNADRYRSIPAPLLWARLPVQGLFAWTIWRGTK